ncbi:MAG TPA: A/G-specific adenine glycosylase [Roseiflexaceae bacterium]|nr:A/G-specific adenine glycosylase [Roseiflexaceae bacterium]
MMPNEPEPGQGIEDQRLVQLQRRLLAWFAAEGRDLPWRRTRDPYAVMVAEVMLQQTQVDRVVPRYLAFLTQFPTLTARAEAAPAEVIRAWAGLGYNRRAVNMQRAARHVLAEYGGSFPRDVAALRQLPGIGPYTAGAIACFAFEQDVGFIDTNIRRVLLRVFADMIDPALTDAPLNRLAAMVVPAGQGWAWNQAIMELGALLCPSVNPICWRCPIAEQCADYQARKAADADPFAVSPPRRRIAERREAPFAGSNRFYRGRVVALLRELAPGAVLALAELGPLLKPEFQPADEAWLQQLVEGLVRDGLVLHGTEGLRLPE